MFKTCLALLLTALLSTATPALAAPYQAKPVDSSISFAGTHAGTAFSGIFENFIVDVDFDPANVAATSLRVTIDLATAKTGNKMFDGTLPNSDWFDTENHPSALFKSTSVEKLVDGTFKATGDLTLRGITKPVSFIFTLDREDAPEINASADFTVDRLAYDIGLKSDPKAEWVSKDIAITLKLVVKKI